MPPVPPLQTDPYPDDFDGPQDDSELHVAALVSVPATRTAEEAIAWAMGQIKTREQNWFRFCQKFVRRSFNVGSGYASAGEQWDHAERRHLTDDPDEIPRGVPVFWETTSSADHVALSIGNGQCISTDIRRAGWPDVCNMADITQGWNAVLLGWSEDLNGVRVYSPPAPPPPPTPTTPHITEAIALNRAYARGLGKITHPQLQKKKAAYRLALKVERVELRKHELK